MIFTARIKSCAAVAAVLAACLILPDTQASADAVPTDVQRAETTTTVSSSVKSEAPAVRTLSAVEVTPLPTERSEPETGAAPDAVSSEEAGVSDPEQETETVSEESRFTGAIAEATKADVERPDDLVLLDDFIATAYCVTGTTSTGTYTTVGRTLAVNPYVIPYCTEVWLYLEDGTFVGDFIAEDTGSNMLANPNVIDIYMGQDSYNDCILWGAQNVQVYIRATAESASASQAQ